MDLKDLKSADDETLKGLAELKFFQESKDAAGFVKQIVDLNAQRGQSIRIPPAESGEKARRDFIEKLKKNAPELYVKPDKESEQAMNDFYATLGRPGDPTEYALPEMEDFDFSAYAEQMASLSKIMHKAGLTQEQFAAVMSGVMETTKGQAAEVNNETEGEWQGLQQRWGLAFDKKLTDALTAAEMLNVPEAVREAMKEKKVPTWMAEVMADAGSRFSPESKELQNQHNSNKNPTPDEAKARIAEIRADKDHPFNNHRHPGYKEAVETVRGLYQSLPGGKEPLRGHTSFESASA